MIKKTCESSDCEKEFIVNAPQQRYCSDRCRWRESKRTTYENRIKDGLCPQCGNKMNNSIKPSYCDDCQKYFQDCYYDQKLSINKGVK